MRAREPVGRNCHGHRQVLLQPLPAVAFRGRRNPAEPGLPPAQSSRRLHNAVAERLCPGPVWIAGTSQSTKEVGMGQACPACIAGTSQSTKEVGMGQPVLCGLPVPHSRP